MSDVTLEDKIQLIYEFNEKSPLFAKVACILIEQKEFEQAIGILEKGLVIYPDYPTALIAYSLTLANIGRESESIKHLSRAADIIDSPETKNYYLKKIKEINASLSRTTEPVKKGFNTELDLAELAKKIENAKIPKIDNSKTYEVPLSENKPEHKIISETMADIYFSQGNLIEALSMYEDILDRNPANAFVLQKKIDEINRKLGL